METRRRRPLPGDSVDGRLVLEPTVGARQAVSTGWVQTIAHLGVQIFLFLQTPCQQIPLVVGPKGAERGEIHMKHLLLAGMLAGLVEIGGATRHDPSPEPEAITIPGARVIYIEPIPNQNWGDRPFTKDMIFR